MLRKGILIISLFLISLLLLWAGGKNIVRTVYAAKSCEENGGYVFCPTGQRLTSLLKNGDNTAIDCFDGDGLKKKISNTPGNDLALDLYDQLDIELTQEYEWIGTDGDWDYFCLFGDEFKSVQKNDSGSMEHPQTVEDIDTINDGTDRGHAKGTCCPTNYNPVHYSCNGADHVICCPQGYTNNMDNGAGCGTGLGGRDDLNAGVIVQGGKYYKVESNGQSNTNENTLCCKSGDDSDCKPSIGEYVASFFRDDANNSPIANVLSTKDVLYEKECHYEYALDCDKNPMITEITDNFGTDPEGVALKEKVCSSCGNIALPLITTAAKKDEFIIDPEATSDPAYSDVFNEISACAKCESNPDAVWTEIGCIEASGSGLVTRIMQIGVGVMGLVIIARIIQIVVILNQPDMGPDKMEDVRNIALSIVYFALLLGGGLIILRFIAYNILGIKLNIFG